MRWLPYMGILLVYAVGLFVDIMEIDAAQYASMSLEMLTSGNYLEVFNRAKDYLDKPPFLFWVSALSMKIFGIGTWQYKLPSVLFSLLGILSTYQLGKRLYGTAVGRSASLILGSSFAMLLINNDIKTDTILVSSIVFSMWMFVSYLQTHRWIYLIGGAVGIGISLLTKGPIGIMLPALAIGGHLILKRKMQRLFDSRFLVAIAIIALLLLPMCLGLYQQFGTDGLKFFFWTQSFGRITGQSNWQNDTSIFFFSHVFLWSFLPWTLLAIVAIGKRFVCFGADLKNGSSEFYTLSGIVVVSLALSLSRFKLPHYIFIVFPLVAIVTAQYIHQLKRHAIWAWFQLILSCAAILLTLIVLLYCFPEGGYTLPMVLLVGLVMVIMTFFMLYRHEQIVFPPFIAFMVVGLAMNGHFYPQLLKYQANSMVGKWVTEREIEENRFISFSTGGHALDFYSKRIVPWKRNVSEAMDSIEKGTIVYASKERYNELLNKGAIPDSTLVFLNFRVQNLNAKFLIPTTRNEVVKPHFLLFY